MSFSFTCQNSINTSHYFVSVFLCKTSLRVHGIQVRRLTQVRIMISFSFSLFPDTVGVSELLFRFVLSIIPFYIQSVVRVENFQSPRYVS